MRSRGSEAQSSCERPGRGILRRDATRAVSFIRLRRTVWQAVALLLALSLLGGGVAKPNRSRAALIAAAVGLPDFNFAAWEIEAIGKMIGKGRRHRPYRLTVTEQVALVRAFIERTERIGRFERELNRLVSEAGLSKAREPEASGRASVQAASDPFQPAASDRNQARAAALLPDIAARRRALAELRRQQAADRPKVEAVLQYQARQELVEAGLALRGFVWPPVQFTFIEPPLKLTVSPRERIATIHSRVLQTEFDPVTLEKSEQAIEKSTGLRAHISRIGGMAVYPAIVVESSSLRWVLNTIAHEWTHHYLFLFPLGLRYARNDEVTTLNETVADIVGDEIGERLARRYYPETLPAAADQQAMADTCACNIYELESEASEAEPLRWERPGRPLQFEFRRAMRETRLHVDALLEAGLVETAEAYMEARRRYFVAQGYPLRVLNQAYFAFHGNYATGPAASSPLGPQLQRLRAESDDLAHFLEQARWFTGLADLEKALEAR